MHKNPFVLVIIGLLYSFQAQANFCDLRSSPRGTLEAALIENELFAQPVEGDEVNTGVDEVYNGRIITCNSVRDSKGGAINRAIRPDHVFANSLPQKTVYGGFDYMGFPINLKYAYVLERDNGNWILTLPIRFHWPSRKPGMIDLPTELSDELGLGEPGMICDESLTMLEEGDGKREIKQGFVPDRSGDIEDIKKIDVVRYSGETACRVPRNLVVGNMSVLNHLRDFWRRTLTQAWNRPGFEVRPLFIDCENAPRGTVNACDSITRQQRFAWDKDGVILNMHFNLKPNHRPSFRRWVFKWEPMHTGVNSHTVVHEMGHVFGLDDEYGEFSDKSERACDQITEASDNYVMCDYEAGRKGTQSVYVWLMTRRYAIGKTPQCERNRDCASGQYCNKGVVGVGRNQCRALLADERACTKDHQCVSGECSQWRPQDGQVSGICYTPNSVPMGQSCTIDQQCMMGKCNSNKRCVCKSDSDCGNGFWCDRGLDAIENSCKRKLNVGEICGTVGEVGVGHRCLSGKCKVSGLSTNLRCKN